MSTPYRAEHLDGLRGLAALVVLLSHLVQIFWIRVIGLGSPLQIFASQASSAAVVAFFVLSGFVIAASAEANVAKNGRFLFRDYFASRIARIYPPFLLAVLVSVLVVVILKFWSLPGSHGPLGFPGDSYYPRDYIDTNGGDVLQSILLLQGLGTPNGSLWSLYIEVKVYFVFAGLFLLLQARRYVIGLLVLLAALKLGIDYNPDFLAYAACWFVGSTFYYLAGRPEPDRRAGGLNALVVVFCMAATVILADADGRTLQALLPSIVALVEAVAIGLILFYSPVRFNVFSRLGDSSYSLYVLHFPLLLLVQSLAVRFAGPSLPASIAASIIAIIMVLGAARAGQVVEDTRGPVRRQLLAYGSMVLPARAS